MKKQLFFLFCVCALRLLGDESALCENMARAIFLSGQGDCPAVIDSLEMCVSKDKNCNINPAYEETFRKQSKSDFYAKSYPLRMVQVSYAAKNLLPKNIYLRLEMGGISESAPMCWLPFSLEGRWVVVLRPLMDAQRKLIHIDECDQARFKGIEAYSFIGCDNLMSVPLPQQDWAVCTQWSPKNKRG